jgi:hypothetical protein
VENEPNILFKNVEIDILILLMLNYNLSVGIVDKNRFLKYVPTPNTKSDWWE